MVKTKHFLIFCLFSVNMCVDSSVQPVHQRSRPFKIRQKN